MGWCEPKIVDLLMLLQEISINMFEELVSSKHWTSELELGCLSRGEAGVDTLKLLFYVFLKLAFI